MPASIAARGGLLVLLVAGSVAGPGLVAHRCLTERDRARHEYSAETFLSVALAGYLEHSPNAEDCGPWLERIAEQTQRMSWAGVFDRDGRGLEFRRRTALPQEEIVKQIDFTARRPQARLLRIGGRESQRFELLTIPRPQDGLTLAVVLDRGPSATRAGSPILVWLAALSLTGLALSWAWFEFGIAGPVRRFARTLANVQEGLTEAALGDLPPSELTELVQSVADIQQELHKWRGQAAQLRRSVETEVDARTREAARAQHRAQREADTDPLTGLENRRVLQRDLPGLLTAHQRRGTELSLVVLDVDHFKRLNDTLGHQSGDRVLAFVGELLRAVVRRGRDRAIRLGGDEFVLVLPGTTASQAMLVAQHLAALFAQRVRTLSGVEPPPGLSAGVAALRQHGAGSWLELLRMADQAMYWAKRQRCGVATVQDAWTAATTGSPPA